MSHKLAGKLLALVAVWLFVLAAAARAEGFCVVTIRIGCDAVTVSFSGFPDDGQTQAVVKVRTDQVNTVKVVEFGGSEASFVVPLSSSDTSRVVVRVKGRTAYEERIKDFHRQARTDLDCTTPTTPPPSLPPPTAHAGPADPATQPATPVSVGGPLAFTGAPGWILPTIIALLAVALCCGGFLRFGRSN